MGKGEREKEGKKGKKEFKCVFILKKTFCRKTKTESDLGGSEDHF